VRTEEEVRRFAARLLDVGPDELSPRDRRVIEKIARRHLVSRDVGEEIDKASGFGGWLADKVAEVGGSWGFLIGFGLVIAGWVVLNVVVLTSAESLDPYPFIFLNLMLSLLAAVQAPVIMMSQNRQAAKDRLAAQHDYEVNLKAEIEIMGLHEKLDDLRHRDLEAVLARLERLVEANTAAKG
jgi:uncharacterized membrane protein